jgi:hypothetical protein
VYNDFPFKTTFLQVLRKENKTIQSLFSVFFLKEAKTKPYFRPFGPESPHLKLFTKLNNFYLFIVQISTKNNDLII